MVANNASAAPSRARTFAYFGPGTGTNPLPLFQAYFQGDSCALVGDASRYTSSNYTSTTFVNPLSRFEGNPLGMPSSLNGDASRRNNALTAGLPRNFFVANPDTLGGANIRGGQVIDGSGNPWFYADVAVKDGHIVAAMPQRVASTRSKAVGVPPRCTWPRTVARVSNWVRASTFSG